jgi:DedD protein
MSGFLKFWRRSSTTNAAATPSRESRHARNTPARQAAAPVEEQLRVSARRRLIGAAVLVALTVLIFPFVFEREPKPVADDIIIEIPRKEGAKPLSPPTGTAAQSQTPAAPTQQGVTVNNHSTENQKSSDTNSSIAVNPSPTPAPQKAPEVKAEAKADERPQPKSETKSVPKAAEKVVENAAEKAAEKAVEKPADKAADKGRFVVQVGAYSDVAKVREIRAKIEKAGIKTYAQSVDSPAGKVWRVRVGPFDNRAAAEKAKAQLGLQGFNAAIITL